MSDDIHGETTEVRRVRFLNQIDKSQIIRFKDLDGVDKERHEYSGPLGSGVINYYYKVENGVPMWKCEHRGLEKRRTWDWSNMPTQRND